MFEKYWCKCLNRVKLFALFCLLLGAICSSLNNEATPIFKPNRYLDVPKYTLEKIQRINVSQRKKESMRQRNLPWCPDKPNNLESKVDIKLRLKELEQNTSFLENILPGGTYIPPNCRSRERLAIIVPYRDRHTHLKKFIPYMHAFLQKQQVHYTIFVAEMVQGVTFNTGLLQNVAFDIADKSDNFSCFVQNDVDLLPTNENNLYRCGDVPKHLCHSNSKYKYRLPFSKYFGGSIALTREQFVKINGFSNLYFGWGSQDEDILARIEHVGYKWDRVPKEIGVYYALGHGKDKGNPYNINRQVLNRTAIIRMNYEGLNSLKYKQVQYDLRDLYTWVLVDVNETEVIKNYTQYYPYKKAAPKKHGLMTGFLPSWMI